MINTLKRTIEKKEMGDHMPNHQRAVEEIAPIITQAAKDCLGNKLDKVILYGSYARGDHDDESDIDILVLANIPADKAWETRMILSKSTGWIDLKYDVLVSLHVTDCATFNKFSDVVPFYMNVVKDEVVLNA